MGPDGNSPGNGGDSGSPCSRDKIDNNSTESPRVTSAPMDEKSEDSNLEGKIQPANEDVLKRIPESNSKSLSSISNGNVQKPTHKLNSKRKAKVFGRGPGRPPGSLNRSTIARLKAEAEALKEFEENSNSFLPTYNLEQLNSTDQSIRSHSYFNGIPPNSQYYPSQYIPPYYPDQNFTSGYMTNPAYVGNFTAYQTHQTPISTQPYTFQPPLPSRTSYGNQDMIINSVSSVAIPKSMQTSLSDRSQGSNSLNNGSNYSNLHNQEFDRRHIELQQTEQLNLQHRYNPIMLPPGTINYNAYQSSIPNGYYHNSNSNSLDLSKTFQPNPVFVPSLPTEPSFATHELPSKISSLHPTHLLPSNVQQITPFPINLSASTTQKLSHTYSQYPAYSQLGIPPYDRFPEPIQSHLPQSYDIYNQSIQRQQLQNEQPAQNNQPSKKG